MYTLVSGVENTRLWFVSVFFGSFLRLLVSSRAACVGLSFTSCELFCWNEKCDGLYRLTYEYRRLMFLGAL